MSTTPSAIATAGDRCSGPFWRFRTRYSWAGRWLDSARAHGTREGVLRKHYVLWDGYVRDTVMYSITDEQWPAVKARLSAARPTSG